MWREKKKKVRKSADGAWFRWCLAQNTFELLQVENLRGTVHLGWQGWRGLGTTGDSDIFQHDSTTFLHLWEIRLSPTLHCRVEGRNCLLLTAENHKPRGFSEVTQSPCAVAPPPLQPCLDRSRDTALTHSPSLQQTLQAACQAEMQHLAPISLGSVTFSSVFTALLPLSPPWTTLPQPCRLLVVLHIRKRKTSLKAPAPLTAGHSTSWASFSFPTGF